jgi:Sec-independent protein translocase protein TatA
MIETSWGEILVIAGVSITLIGRKDLPKASYFLGSKIGQVVGLLQGARARADKFATNNELKALQNELRSGLRELDSVKGELAVAASSRGLVGRGLGRTIGGSGMNSVMNSGMNSGAALASNPMNTMISSPTLASTATSIPTMSSPPSTSNTVVSNSDYFAAAKETGDTDQGDMKPMEQLPPRSQSVAAVAEEEWGKQGIGFKSRAEMGTGSTGAGDVSMSGSYLLSDLMQQSLIHDQYDRAVHEQDELIRSRVEKTKQKHDKTN